MSQNLALLTLPLIASGPVASKRFVAYDGTQAESGDAVQGVSRSDAVDGEAFSVDTIGTAIVEAGGAVEVGNSLEVDANGRAVPDTAGGNPQVARALESATSSGQPIEVLLIGH